jgi:polyketide cyclase/dehydrase/lipid transport protein
MGTASYEVTARSDAPPERLFELISDAPGWPLWAGPLIAHGSWEQEGNPPPGGVGAIRKIGRWPQFGREQVVRHDPPGHHAYVIVGGQPVRNYRADVYFRREGDGTLISWVATFEPLIPGTGRLVAAVYRRIIGGVARRLAAYAEAHPS